MNKGVKSLLATLMVGTSVLGVNQSGEVKANETVKDKDNEEVKSSEGVKDFDKKFENLDKEREQSEEQIQESLDKIDKFEKEVEELKGSTADLRAELKKIEGEKEELEEDIKDNESKNNDLNDELIKLGNERTELEKEKDEYIELLNNRLAVFFKNNQDDSVIDLLKEGASINDVLDKFKKMNNITEQDLEVIEKLLNVIQDIEEKETEISDKIEEINGILESLTRDYHNLEDLEIKTKLLENELNIAREDVEELIKSEELSVQSLQDKIKGIDEQEREVMGELEIQKNNITMTEYREYLKEYRENVELTKERIEKDKERLEELIEKREEEERLVKEYRDTLYDLKDYNEELILEREKELEKILELKREHEEELADKRKELEKMEDLKKTSEEDLEKLKEELKALQELIDDKEKSYEELVFDSSVLEDIDNKKLDIDKKEKELKELKREYNKKKLTEHEESLIKELEESIKQYEEELEVISGEGLMRPTYGKHTYGYGPRSLLKGESFHYGIDIANKTGTPILSVYDGKVVRSVRNDSIGYGNYIVVEHKVGDQILTTLYAHLSVRDVKVGDTVKKGEVIGLMGNTGWSTGPHLHFEIYNGKKNGLSFKNIQNPKNYFGDNNFSKSNLYKTK